MTECNPLTCTNGKCNATGECVDKPLPGPVRAQCCNKTVFTRCPDCLHKTVFLDGWMTQEYERRRRASVETAEVTAEVMAEAADGTPVSLDTLLADMTEENRHPEFPTPPIRTRLIDTDSATRKTFPMARGLLDYFPDALAEVSRISYLGNQKHNPGEEIHHARGKSTDHADCILRHLVGRGGFDGDTRESAALAWRALALLQEELEAEMGLPLPRGARAA